MIYTFIKLSLIIKELEANEISTLKSLWCILKNHCMKHCQAIFGLYTFSHFLPFSLTKSLEELFQERGFSKDSEHKIDQVRLKTEIREILFLLLNYSFIQYNEFHLTERDDVYDGVYGKY